MGADVSAEDYGRQLWREPPSPFVTHADMAPVHMQIGELKKGQEHILTTYSHLRGEMLQGFDQVLATIKRDQRETEARTGITLSAREAILAVVAIGAGAMILTYSVLRHAPDSPRAASAAMGAVDAIPE